MWTGTASDMSDGATVGRSEKAGLPQAFAHYLCVQWWVGVVYLYGFPFPHTNNLKINTDAFPYKMTHSA